MKKIFTTLFALTFGTLCLAQEAGSLSGTLVNQEGESAPFVSILILDEDSSMVKGGATDSEGKFEFNYIPSGKFRIQTSSIEYKKYISDFFTLSANEKKKLDPIKLLSAVQHLEDVQITAIKPLIEVMPDKTVFNVESSPNASGSNGMELLRKSPGVIIDNNDNIILQGKNGVIVYIDDKPVRLSGEDLVSMLRGMQSDQIEAIEIITNPSSKYDAEGNAGIINIKLKRDKNLGTNGTFTTGFSKGKRERYRAGITLNHKQKKFSAFGNYNLYDNRMWNFNDLNRTQNNAFYNQESDQYRNVKGGGYRLGVDYLINKKNTIGFAVNGYNNNLSGNTNSHTNISQVNTLSIDSILQANNTRERSSENINVNFNYQYKGEKGNSLNVDLDYGEYGTEGNNFQPNEYFANNGSELLSARYFTNLQNTDIAIRTAKADYEMPLGKGKFSFGAKFSSVKTDNSFTQYLQETRTAEQELQDRSSLFEYTEEVTAAYANYFSKISEKISLNAGLRLEGTLSKGDLDAQNDVNDKIVSRKYANWFPSGGVTYALNKKNQFAFNYSRRINRPDYQDLNPFEFQLDELTYQKGNPFLNPQFSNNYQLTHTFSSFLNTQLSYSITNDFFAQVIEQSRENIGATLLQQQNLATSQNYGLNVSAPFDIVKWWGTYTSVSLNKSVYDAPNLINISVTTFNIYMQHNFTAPKGFKFEVSGWYNSPSIWGGTFLTSRMYSVDVGLKKSVFKENGTITIGVSDIFLSQRWTGESDYNNVLLNISGGWDSRRFKVGFSYRFGNQRVRIRNRKTGLEDEASRIKSDN